MAKKKKAPRLKRLDPSKLTPRQAALSHAWRDLERVRQEAYRILMPDLPSQLVKANDSAKWQAIIDQADREWHSTTGQKPINTLDNLERVMETVQTAGHSATEVGLHAWVAEQLKGVLSSEKREAETPPPRPTITVDISQQTVSLGGARHEVASQQTLRWLKVLADHRGEWISARELVRYDSELRWRAYRQAEAAPSAGDLRSGGLPTREGKPPKIGAAMP